MFFQNPKKKLFRATTFTFCPYKHHYYSPLPSLRKILKFLVRCHSQINLILTKRVKQKGHFGPQIAQN